jgi:universal stress protein F
MYRHILVPIDPTQRELAPRLLKVAKFLAGEDGKISLLTVLDPVPSYVAHYIPAETLEKNRDELHDQLAALATEAGVDAKPRLRTGSPSHVILEEAERQHCDAIVLASHRPDYRDYLLGSTASRVVRHAQCTVIVDRPEEIPERED